MGDGFGIRHLEPISPQVRSPFRLELKALGSHHRHKILVWAQDWALGVPSSCVYYKEVFFGMNTIQYFQKVEYTPLEPINWPQCSLDSIWPPNNEILTWVVKGLKRLGYSQELESHRLELSKRKRRNLIAYFLFLGFKLGFPWKEEQFLDFTES